MEPTRRKITLFAAITLLAAACGGGSSSTSSPLDAVLEPIPPEPPIDTARAEEGARLYAQYCAACHGPDLEGDPDWKVPNADGSYPPPPHDSSGHTWHHPVPQLVELVLRGPRAPGSTMPRFDGTLDEAEVAAIIEYFRSTWGPEERAFNWRVTYEYTRSQGS